MSVPAIIAPTEAQAAPAPGDAAAPLAQPARSAAHEARIPILDGVRGLAILLVMGHHLFVMKPATWLDRQLAQIAHNGWWGVDLFFVLSGFLITGILFDSKHKAHYFRNFYARRTVRIFPLYYAFLLVMLVILPRFQSPAINRFGTPEGSPLWYWSYLANFHMGWVGHFTHKTLSVAWSLAIEEQFYLIWPAVVLFLSRRHLLWLCGAMILTSIGTRLALTLFDANPGFKIYALTPCRLDGLAVGAWIALTLRSPGGIMKLTRLARPIGIAAIGGIVGVTLLGQYYADNLLDPLFFTMLALAFGALLVICLGASSDGLLSRTLGSAPLRVFGTYSYAIYLLHYPIALVLKDSFFKPASFPTLAGSPLPGQILFYLLATAISLGMALLSWHLFEKHFLKLKKYFPSGK